MSRLVPSCRCLVFVLVSSSPFVVAACGDDDGPTRRSDAGRDASATTDTGPRMDATPSDAGPSTDAGVTDTAPAMDTGPAIDATPADANGEDAGPLDDAGVDPRCAPQDARGEGACEAIVGIFWDGFECSYHSGCRCVGEDCDAGYADIESCMAAHEGCRGPTPCVSDDGCARGAQWCIDGRCAPCDNSGLACFLLCADGTAFYERNGCTPCDCQPINDCESDDDCVAPASRCYAGRFCWPGCAPGDPKCCQGNTCDVPGCEGPSPVGCRVSGCPAGESCALESGCEPSSCFCDATTGGWGCTDDCGGGECRPVPPGP